MWQSAAAGAPILSSADCRCSECRHRKPRTPSLRHVWRGYCLVASASVSRFVASTKSLGSADASAMRPSTLMVFDLRHVVST